METGEEMNAFGSKSLNAITNESILMFLFEEEKKNIQVYLLFFVIFHTGFYIHTLTSMLTLSV